MRAAAGRAVCDMAHAGVPRALGTSSALPRSWLPAVLCLGRLGSAAGARGAAFGRPLCVRGQLGQGSILQEQPEGSPCSALTYF